MYICNNMFRDRDNKVHICCRLAEHVGRCRSTTGEVAR